MEKYISSLKTCCHQVDFWFEGTGKITPELQEKLTEEAETRATEMIIDGCSSGELNYDNNFRGWFEIVK